jgi:hypothetical protein
MNPATLQLIIWAVQEAIVIEPKVADIIRKVMDKQELTNDDLEVIKAKTLSLKINVD